MTPSRQHHARNLKYVSTIRVSLATRFVRMVTYLNRLQSIKTHDPSITWSDEIAWHTKTIISPLPNLVGWWLTSRAFYLWRHVAIQSHDLVWLRDKLKAYLHYHDAFGHKNWHNDDLPRVVSTESHDHIITWWRKITWQTKIHNHNVYDYQTWQGGNVW